MRGTQRSQDAGGPWVFLALERGAPPGDHTARGGDSEDAAFPARRGRSCPGRGSIDGQEPPSMAGSHQPEPSPQRTRDIYLLASFSVGRARGCSTAMSLAPGGCPKKPAASRLSSPLHEAARAARTSAPQRCGHRAHLCTSQNCRWPPGTARAAPKWVTQREGSRRRLPRPTCRRTRCVPLLTPHFASFCRWQLREGRGQRRG